MESAEPENIRSKGALANPQMPTSIFQPGRNCWRIENSPEVKLLIDADAFYRAFVTAAALAQEQLFILGWDTDSRTELPWPDDDATSRTLNDAGLERSQPLTLGLLLTRLVATRPKLQVFILSWDYTFIYIFERESLPGLKFSQLTGPRFRFVLDQRHPHLASHHQKIVVIDDALAFSGGLDLTQRRWDTPEHLGQDDRRVDPGGHRYGPFHDVQMRVSGAAARALGELCRERWQLATQEKILGPQLVEPVIAPMIADKSSELGLHDVSVAIARTLPQSYFGVIDGEPSKPVLEVERLFLDAIRSATNFIYIENQYFTSPLLAKAMATRLREPDGPEILLVLPRDQTGWIEESTMGFLRSEALRVVEEADTHKRFRCFHPVVPALEDGYVKVHSKVMVIDDRFLRVGSANMNSRSMGLDTECDLAFEKGSRSDLGRAIENFRLSLMGEHLGVSPEEVRACIDQRGSLTAAVDSLLKHEGQGPVQERTLVPIHPTDPNLLVKSLAPPKDWIDPSAPRGLRRWLTRKVKQNRFIFGAGLIVLVTMALLGLLVLERANQLPEWMGALSDPTQAARDVWMWARSWDAEKISGRLIEFRGEPHAVPSVLLGFVLGSLVFVPVTAMILGIALTFPVHLAIPLALAGALLSATMFYGIGRYWAWTKSKTLDRPWVRRLSHQMSKGGVFAVTAVRLAPIAPFAAVGIVAGGLKISFRNYFLGSLLGFLPGITAICWISHQTVPVGESRGWMGIVWCLLGLSLFSFLMPRLISRMKKPR